jgi:hypothetical protein
MVGTGFEGSVKEYLEVRLGYSLGMLGVSAERLLDFASSSSAFLLSQSKPSTSREDE